VIENLLNLTPILTSSNLCPAQATANAAAYQTYQAKQQSPGNTASNTANAAVGGAAKTLAPFDPKLPVK
jgi:hypothetical protein